MEEVIYVEPFVEREKAPVLEMSDIARVRKDVEEEEKLGEDEDSHAENLRTRVRTLIDTSRNKAVCYDENEGSYTERDTSSVSKFKILAPFHKLALAFLYKLVILTQTM